MADILEFHPKDDNLDIERAREALEQAHMWTCEAIDYFDKTTVDYVALEQVLKAVEAVLDGLDATEALRKQGIKMDRTYRPKK